MIFEQVATGGCQSYLLGCADTCAGVLIDPEVSQVDRYLALAAREASGSASSSTPTPMPTTSRPRAGSPSGSAR
jgi:hypothetical protein